MSTSVDREQRRGHCLTLDCKSVQAGDGAMQCQKKKKGQVLQSNNRFAILPSHGPSAAY